MDGSLDFVRENTETVIVQQDTDLNFGNNPTLARQFDGVIGEVRISNIVRSDCWLETGFANQNSPNSFYDVGQEQVMRRRLTALSGVKEDGETDGRKHEEYTSYFEEVHARYITDGTPKDLTFDLPPGAAPESLTVYLTSFGDGDHRIEISLNGRYVDSYTWCGKAAYQATVDHPDLREGTNTLTIECRNAPDPIRVDAFRATYRKY